MSDINEVEVLNYDEGLELAVSLGLTPDEYKMVCDTQGRCPSICELTIYSLMWSEHCGYKHSKNELKKFPTHGKDVIQGPGENAGVIDVGEGWALAFKAESHNHPSAVEPYQGAATGVGGIIRDIFAMGARPMACLDSLRFGSLSKPRQRYLLDGAVAGIGGYGNCLGVPTVGGEIYFDECYEGNCLIDVLGVGIMRREDLQSAAAEGDGNWVVLLGSTTGRDGIGGASVLASQEFDEAAENKRPAVQVGDPFEEKKLIEVCLELLQRNLFASLSDLGAAGLTSSASEMASHGGKGIEIEVTLVPQREPNMTPAEIMVSESQERMLAVVEPSNWDAVKECCDRWGVRCTKVGTVNSSGRFAIRENGQLVADIPADKLADNSPRYNPEARRPQYLDELQAFDPHSLDLAKSREELEDALLKLMACPNIASKRWIYEQYDYQVQSGTAVVPGAADACVLRVGAPGRGNVTRLGVAISTDCNSRYCHVNPRLGAEIALVEAARNVTCVGATPTAITNCLNFGNPDKPEVFYVFRECIEGLAHACEVMETPVTGGNVSLYNESFGKAIWPTPMVGMVGKMHDFHKRTTMAFRDPDDVIILLGENKDELGASQYLHTLHGVDAGNPPSVDFDAERSLQKLLLRLIDMHLVKSAHDCSEGGLATCLAESAIAGNIGCTVDLDDDIDAAALLFGETQGRIVITIDPKDASEIAGILETTDVPFEPLGYVGGDSITITDDEQKTYVDMPLSTLANAYNNSIEHYVTCGEPIV